MKHSWFESFIIFVILLSSGALVNYHSLVGTLGIRWLGNILTWGCEYGEAEVGSLLLVPLEGRILRNFWSPAPPGKSQAKDTLLMGKHDSNQHFKVATGVWP